ncbi:MULTISPECIES: hypothetical protein [Streptomyces]|uniref:hypothetical protein n=1 Tax=Streptomyces TaxID=1883 RepID=UPI00135BAE82|nr:hypothetical protein [Streptomyces sp. NHF165]
MPHGRSARKRGECPRRSAELAALAGLAELAEHAALAALAALAELAVFAERAALAELVGLAELAELACKHGMCPECQGCRQPPAARGPFALVRVRGGREGAGPRAEVRPRPGLTSHQFATCVPVRGGVTG